MTSRRLLSACTLLLTAVACEPKIAETAAPASVVTALFDPLANELPLPNDLLLGQDPATLPAPAAQRELIAAFQAQRGFPNDQEVAVTIDFARNLIAGNGSVTRATPRLDLSSFNAGTFFVYGVTAAGAGDVALDPIQPADYVAGPDPKGTRGTLTLHRQGRQPWAPGQYLVLVRGGAGGVRTLEGDPVQASSVFFLVAQGGDMTSQANLELLKVQAGSAEAALALAQQLNQLIAGYRPAFAVADSRFPHQELAILVTFTVAPAATQVELDPGRGLVPLPIDLLRDPRAPSAGCAACGKLTPLAACTLAGGTLNAAGTCSSAAAAGFAALDGFGTTAPLLAPTSDLVQASTVTSTSLQLYDLSTPAAPVLVPASSYITEPCEFASQGVSPVIAIQPAGATSCDATSVFRTRPLKDNTSYAVVITTDVKDKTGKAIAPGTVAKVLLFTNPVSVGGKSQLQGIDDATAFGLETMRLQLIPVVTASGLARSKIAMAYTFKTQSILGLAAQLGALPYVQAPATALPGAVTALTPTAAFARYGVDPAIPHGNIAEVLETTLTTFDLLDPASGAFHPDPAQAVPETIRVLIATPRAAAAPACTGALGPFGKCSPMMIFRHGFGGGRADMLTVADTFTAQGLTVVAIDAAKHGERAFCSKGDATTLIPGTTTVIPICNDFSACASPLPAGAQGDAKPPGSCGSAGYTHRPVSTSCLLSPASCGWTGSDGIPWVSANFLVSSNFFRSRDTFRQDIIDQSQQVRALAFAPSGLPPTGHAVFDHMVGGGVIIDPAAIYYSGQSLGAIHGTMTVATNPRVSKAVLNVGGGTVVDIFTNSPAFSSSTNALLAGLGIAPGTSAYLQFLAVAKTILDPADPVNYAGHLTASTLPNLLPPLGGNPDGSVPQAAKKILTQVAFCDQTVPNPFSFVWASTAGTGPLLGAPGFGGPGTFQLFAKGSSIPDLTACPAPGGTSIPASAVGHGFITDWADATTTGKAQSDAAAFVLTDTLPASLVVLP